MTMSETSKATVRINVNLWLVWIMGWLFTIGITLEVSAKPYSFWESLGVLLFSWGLWPAILGVYCAKLLGTY